MTLTQASELATIIGVVVAGIGVVYAAFQIRRTALISEGQFLLELTKMFKEHDAVHIKLRPAGDWRKIGQSPGTPEEWAAVDAYMGLLERCEVLMAQKSLDQDVFARLFAYRVDNLLAQDAIVDKKLRGGERAHWNDFIKLSARLKKMGVLHEEVPPQDTVDHR